MDGGLKEKKMNINIEIKGQQAHIVNQQSLISGTSNLEEIKFDFSSEWDGYTKTAVIYVDDYSISDSVKVLVEKDVVSAEKLPDWLFREECELYIGVFGDNSEGRRITSTIVCQKVKKGVPVDVVNEITPDIYNQIIKIMCDTKALVKEATDKVKINGEYLEKASEKATDAENSANKAKEYLNATENNKLEVEKLTEAKMNDIDSIVNAKIGDINALVEAKNKGIDSLVEAKSNDIATLTTAKMEDIANVTNAKLGDINNKATSQISAINNTATSQIKAINNTAISQIKNMTVKYSDMCRTLGIEHEGIINITNNKTVSIDVRKYKYIKFGTANTKGGSFKDYTLPPQNDWCSIFCAKEEFDFSKPIDGLFEVTSNKEYDISTFDDLYLRYSSMDNTDYGYINYKLYNKSEETTEE